MKLLQTGVILFTDNYNECVDFYENIIGLTIIEQKEKLTNFQFGSGYLMIESGGPSSRNKKSKSENPTVIRFDVDDISAAANELRGKNIDIKVSTFDWGIIATLFDPDGNRCEVKEISTSFTSIRDNLQ